MTELTALQASEEFDEVLGKYHAGKITKEELEAKRIELYQNLEG